MVDKIENFNKTQMGYNSNPSALSNKSRAGFVDVKAIVTDIQIAGLDKKALEEVAKKLGITDVSSFVALTYKYNKQRIDDKHNSSVFQTMSRKAAQATEKNPQARNFKLASEKFASAKNISDMVRKDAEAQQGGQINQMLSRIQNADSVCQNELNNFMLLKNQYDKSLKSDSIWTNTAATYNQNNVSRSIFGGNAQPKTSWA